MKFLSAVLAALIVCFFSLGSSAPQHGRGKKNYLYNYKNNIWGSLCVGATKMTRSLGHFGLIGEKNLGSYAKTVLYDDIVNQSLSVRRGDGYIDTGGVYDSPEAQAYWATR